MFRAGSRPDSRPFDVRRGRDDWRARLRRIPWLTLVVIAVGGVIGALARQGLWAVFPRHASVFDWTTLGINVGGCLLIGALMTTIGEVGHAHRLTGPFLGVGVLGGFTTFSTYIVDSQQLIRSGVPQTALAYLAVTLAAALAAVYAGVTLARLLARTHRIHTSRILSLSDDLPIAIVIVDAEDKIRAFLPQLDELVAEGLVIIDPVEVIRYVGRLAADGR